MKIRLLPFLLLFFLAAACQGGSNAAPTFPIGEDADPEIVAGLPFTSRSFEMGTAGFVPPHYPDSTDADWGDFLAWGAALYGGYYGVHVSPAEPANEEGVLEQVQLAFEKMQGVQVYVALAVGYEEGPFTEARGEQLKRAAVAVAEKYHPQYISLGVEINSFYLFEAESFDLYVQYVRETYDAIKAVSPDTLVMNNFQLERMKGAARLTGQSFPAHWELIDRFAGKMDLVSFTVYPFLQYTTVEAIPDDYLAEIREHTDLPVIITETGWPTQDLPSGVSGSDQAQIDYILKLAQQANGLGVKAIIWVFPNDGDFGIAGGIFDHLSLFDNEGNPKAAYEYWKAINALPLQ